MDPVRLLNICLVNTRKKFMRGIVISPSSKNNLVGIKPTVGLTSRAGVVPISANQDTVGPIVRSVADGAAILSVIAGRDPLDNFTFAQPVHVPDYTKALRLDALKGARIGVPRVVFTDPAFTGTNPAVNIAFNQSLAILQSLGATIVDPANLPSALAIANSNNETIVLDTDFKACSGRFS
jgi:amidase